MDAEEYALQKAAEAQERLARVAETQLPLHDQVVAGFVKARAAMMPHEKEHGKRARDEWFDSIEETLRHHLTPLLKPLIDHPDVPQEIKDLIGVAVSPTQANELTVVLMIAGALLFPLVTAFLAPASLAVGMKAFEIPGNDITPLSPAEMAAAKLKGVLGPLDFYGEGAKFGLTQTRMDTLYNIAGNAIGIEEAIRLWRRGDIDDTELARIVHYSNIRSDFLDDIRKLRYDNPSRNEALTGRLKGHLDDATARTFFSQAGGELRNYDWMLASSGRPISPEEMVRLWNRNEATELDVDAAVAQSDINPAYLDFVKKLRWYVPPVRSIMAMLRSTAIDDAKATALFKENGVRDADIPGYLAEAHHARTQSVKELSQAQVLRLYGAKFITVAEATTRLAALGYLPADITLLLGFADEVQHERYVNAVVTRIHAKYTTYKLTAAEAQHALIQDGIPAAAITDYMRLWAIEREASIHVLSPAAIVGAYRRQEIPPAECKARLLAIGVQQADLKIIVADGFPPAKVDQVMVDAVVNA